MGLAFNVFIAAFSSIGAFLFGYDSGIISTVLAMNSFVTRFGDNPSIQGAIVSTFNGGCFFGAMGAGWANDKFGRKRTIQIGTLWALWGCAMQTGAHNIATLIVGRVIAGVAIGILSMTVPLYNTEIAPPKIRGFLVGLTQQLIGIGFIVANWVGYGCQFIKGDAGWRLALGLQLMPAALLLFGIQFLPFSPRWLLEVGRDTEARDVVYRLHGIPRPQIHPHTDNKTSDSEAELDSDSAAAAAEKEYIEMRNTIKAESLIRTKNIRVLWSTKPMLRRTLVGCGVQIFGQFSGINIINYFGPQMWKSLGVEGGKAILVQGIYGAVGPIANFFFITFILDLVGRKKPLLFGAGTFIATFSILAAILATNPLPTTTTTGSVVVGDVNPAAQRAGIAMIFLTSIVFSLSFGPVSWVLASEVFPTNTRSLGTSVATCSNWALNTLLSQVSPLAITNVGYKFYLVFVCLNFVDFIVILVFFPETRGKTLEEMNDVFGDTIDARKVLDENGGHARSNGDGSVDAEKHEVEVVHHV